MAAACLAPSRPCLRLRSANPAGTPKAGAPVSAVLEAGTLASEKLQKGKCISGATGK